MLRNESANLCTLQHSKLIHVVGFKVHMENYCVDGDVIRTPENGNKGKERKRAETVQFMDNKIV